MTDRFNRREWMKAASLIALAPSIPQFLRSSVHGAETDPQGRILVVIQLDGGNDGINTIVPYADDGYAKHRRTLKLETEKLIKVNDQIGLHPSLRPLGELLDDGRLAVVQGVGYPNPNRSHDVSMAIWQTARMDPTEHASFGWLGRALDENPVPTESAARAMLIGDRSAPRAIVGRKSSFAVLDRITDLQRNSPLANSSTITKENSTGEVGDDLAAFVQRTTLDAYATSDLLAEAVAKGDSSSAGYPGSTLGRRLKMVSQLIKAGFGTSVYYAVQGGYDTHSLQLQAHSSLLNELSSSLKAFLNDLRASSLDDRVVVLCFSEFGRRVDENGSFGTDHGTAGPVFIAGTPVRAELYGKTPSLLDLEDDDLKSHIDFRQVYATVLERWLQVKSDKVLSETYQPLNFL